MAHTLYAQTVKYLGLWTRLFNDIDFQWMVLILRTKEKAINKSWYACMYTTVQSAPGWNKCSEIVYNHTRIWAFSSLNHVWFQAQYLLHSASKLIEIWFVWKEVLGLYNAEVHSISGVLSRRYETISTITVPWRFDPAFETKCDLVRTMAIFYVQLCVIWLLFSPGHLLNKTRACVCVYMSVFVSGNKCLFLCQLVQSQIQMYNLHCAIHYYI